VIACHNSKYQETGVVLQRGSMLISLTSKGRSVFSTIRYTKPSVKNLLRSSAGEAQTGREHFYREEAKEKGNRGKCVDNVSTS